LFYKHTRLMVLVVFRHGDILFIRHHELLISIGRTDSNNNDTKTPIRTTITRPPQMCTNNSCNDTFIASTTHYNTYKQSQNNNNTNYNNSDYNTNNKGTTPPTISRSRYCILSLLPMLKTDCLNIDYNI
jgi:hypothetical protein